MFLTAEWDQKGHTEYLNIILKIYSSTDNSYKLTEYLKKTIRHSTEIVIFMTQKTGVLAPMEYSQRGNHV